MSERATGRLIGIARRPAHRAPMQTVEAPFIEDGGGVEGDHKGRKFPRRGVTILAREAWEAALAELGEGRRNAADLPWTARRANLLVEGVELPRALGGIVRSAPCARGHLPDDAVQAHGRSARGPHACALSAVARRRHVSGARGRARCDRRPVAVLVSPPERHGPPAGLSGPRETQRVQRPGHCTLVVCKRHRASRG